MTVWCLCAIRTCAGRKWEQKGVVSIWKGWYDTNNQQAALNVYGNGQSGQNYTFARRGGYKGEELKRRVATSTYFLALLPRSLPYNLFSPMHSIAVYALPVNLLYGHFIDMHLRTSQKGLRLMWGLIRSQNPVSLSLTRHRCTNYSKEFFQRGHHAVAHKSKGSWWKN